MRFAAIAPVLLTSVLIVAGCSPAREGKYDGAKPEAPHQVVEGVRIALEQYRQNGGEVVARFWIRNDAPAGTYSFVAVPNQQAMDSAVLSIVDQKIKGRFSRDEFAHSSGSGFATSFTSIGNAFTQADGKVDVVPGKTAFFDVVFRLSPTLEVATDAFTVELKGTLGDKPLTHTVTQAGEPKK